MSQAIARPSGGGRLLLLVAAMMFVAIAGAAGLRSMASAQGGPNTICQAMGFDYGFKVGEDPTGTHTVTYVDAEGETQTAGSLTVTENDDETGIDWSSTFSVYAVLVKGGPGANQYDYPGGSMGDTGLLTNVNPNNPNGFRFELSNVVFCYDGIENGGGDPQEIQYTVSIAKWVEGATPADGSFDFTATWTAANLNGGVETSGNFTLDASNGYTATTSAMDAGASYSVVENGIDGSCEPGDAYRLLGYTVGSSWAEAQAAVPGPSASIGDLQSNQYVVVHNQGCGDVSPTGDGSITIVKQGLTDGVGATFTHDVPGDSDTFVLDWENNSITFDGLPAGDYQFTELPIEGWTLLGAGCSLANARSAQAQDEAVGNTVVAVLGEDMDLVCTFVNGQAQELQHTVTIHKYVDGALAAEGSFDLTATWTAANLNGGLEASGNFSLNETNSFMAVTAAMDAGANYSVVENGIDGACDPGDEYRLLGYGLGTTLEAAAAAAPVPTAAFTDLQANQYVVVHNEPCDEAAQYTVTVTKYVDFAPATEGSFDFTATWTAANLNGGAEASGDFSLNEANSFTAITAAMDAGANYSVVENGIDMTCEGDDEYRLLGYGLGETLEAAVAAVVADPADTAAFTDLQANQYVVVHNEPCPTGSITIVKEGLTDGVEAVFTHDVPGDSDTFTLTAEDNSFTIEALEAGSYNFTELPIEGWQLVSAGCAFAPAPLAPEAPGDTLTVVLGEGEQQVCTFVNEMEPGSVTVAKYVDGAPAVDGSFEFTETTPAAESVVILDSSNGFVHTTDDIPGGTPYSLVENGIDAVCDEGDLYRIAGYTMGETMEEALAGEPMSEVMIDALMGDVFVIAWNQDCANLGTITIVKDFAPDADAEASFTTEGLGTEDFTITEGDENGMTFENLGIGDYTFTEEFIAGWTIQSIFCSGQQSPSSILVNLGAASLTVSLTAGDDIICTFTNMEDASNVPGNLTIVKDWGDDAGVDTSFTVSENLGVEGNVITLMDSEGADSRAFEDLAPATYSFVEGELEGWTLTGIDCTGQDSPQSIVIDLTTRSLDVNLQPGESIVCTFTNSMDDVTPVETGSITINKVANPNLAVTFSFTATGEGLSPFVLATGGDAASATTSFMGLAPGTYTVTETDLQGWTVTNIVCEGAGEGSANGDVNTGTATIELVVGADVECTYTNTQDELLAVLDNVPFFPVPVTNVPTTPNVNVPTTPNNSDVSSGLPDTTGPVPSTSNPVTVVDGNTFQNPSSVLGEQTPLAPSTGNGVIAGSGSDVASPLGLAIIIATLLGGSAVIASAASRR